MIKVKFANIETIFECHYNSINTLVIENTKMFREIIYSIITKLDGEEGNVYFSENATDAKLSSIALCRDYYEVNINKKTTNILQKDIISRLNGNLYEWNQWYQKGYEMLDNVLNNYDSCISIDDDMDIASIVKLFNPTFAVDEETNLLEKLINYINILVEFSDVRLLIFVSIEDYFDKEELELLFKTCQYKEVSLLIIESSHRYRLDNEKTVLIDNDLCEIID